ncbi:YihY/virulence factor BrkB family protein [Microbacterium sp. 4R-513]|uniref:YihY/virulence factor BrkB family protein n=1 Tax=Microbacterium sp. 4R-513 TaxID=2567934 RepID=UPI0013E197C4|nr:YihY/virulence factor BrkB family protein [Microbacterium sp. 4R-513]QIG38361.1 YihY/virulence factor BrkB family protein [Microbacterium sp. 4R-513]
MTASPPSSAASRDAPGKRDAAAKAKEEEQALRERWDQTQTNLRQRFDRPISRATELTQATLAWFPVRVWRHFLQTNGFLLGAGVSYQALFAVFAAIYVAFAGIGLWLGGSEQAVQALINVINSYIPNLISDEGGIVTPAQVQAVATESTGVLGITGVIALGALIWTAIGFVTYSRRAVRDIFELPYDHRSYVLLKARDLLAAFIFGIALVVGAGLSTMSTWAITLIFGWLGLDASSGIASSLRIGSLVVSFIIISSALAALFRFLTGATLQWRRIWPGSLLGGAAVTVVLLGAGLLVSYTPSNPLLATFAIFVGLLLWFKIVGIIMLVAAAWIATSAGDRNVPLLEPSEADKLAAEHRALVVAAHVRLRTAQESRAHAPWYGIWAADRALRQAEQELAEVEASAPPPPSANGQRPRPKNVGSRK